MPQYTVKYFNFKALGECLRLLLAYNGEDFKDVRLTMEEWAAEKSKTPFGQMPILEVDGKVYAQSTAISRYLGKKFGLGGNTLEEDLEIDIIVDTFHDLRARLATAHYESDEAVKERKYKEIEPMITPLLEKLEAVAAANDGHVALGKLTWGDFIVAGFLDYIKVMLRVPDFDSKYPHIKKISDNVHHIPNVQAYVTKGANKDVAF